MLSYSYDDEQERPDTARWVEKSVEWLQKTFNPEDNRIAVKGEDGEIIREIRSDNVKSVVVHMDEAVPHIHAFVVPID